MDTGTFLQDHKGITRGKCSSCACLSYENQDGSNKCKKCSCPSIMHEAQSGCIGSHNCSCKEYVSVVATNDCYSCGHHPKDHRGLGRITVPSCSSGHVGQRQVGLGQSMRFSDMFQKNKHKRQQTFGRGKGKGPLRADPNTPTFRKVIKLQLKRPKWMKRGKKKNYVDDGDQQQVVFNKVTTLDNILRAGVELFLNIKEENYGEILSEQGTEIFLLDGKAKVTDPTYTFNKVSFQFGYVLASELSYGIVSSPNSVTSKRSQDFADVPSSNSEPACSRNISHPEASKTALVPLNKQQLLNLGQSILPPTISTQDPTFSTYRVMTFDVMAQGWQPLGMLSLNDQPVTTYKSGGMKSAITVKCGSHLNHNPWLEDFTEGSEVVVKKYLATIVDRLEEAKRDLKKVAMKEVQTQMVVGHLAKQFNEKIEQASKKTFQHKIEVIPSFLIEEVNSSRIEPLFLERKLDGLFIKYINNCGKPTKHGLNSQEGQLCMAFCHWTYQFTDGELLVTDLQGVGLTLTDVEVSTTRQGTFGIGNLGVETIADFKKVHNCNGTCKLLSLTNFKTVQGDEEVEKSVFVI